MPKQTKYNYAKVEEQLKTMSWDEVAEANGAEKRNLMASYHSWRRRRDSDTKSKPKKSENLDEVIADLEARLATLNANKEKLERISQLQLEIAEIENEIERIGYSGGVENPAPTAENPPPVEKSDITQQAENTDASEAILEASNPKSELSDADEISAEDVLDDLNVSRSSLDDATRIKLFGEDEVFIDQAEDLTDEQIKVIKYFVDTGHDAEDVADIMYIRPDVVYDIVDGVYDE